MLAINFKKYRLINSIQSLDKTFQGFISLMILWLVSCVLLTIYCYLHSKVSNEPVFGIINSLYWAIQKTIVFMVGIGVLLYNYERLIQLNTKNSVVSLVIVLSILIDYWLFGNDQEQNMRLYFYQNIPKLLLFSIITFSFLNQKKSIQKGTPKTSLQRNEVNDLLVSNGLNDIFIKISEIDHIKSYGNYIQLYDVKKSSYIHRMTMKAAEAYFSDYGFARVHRSHLVLLSKVRQLNKRNSKQMEVILQSGEVIPVGINYRDQFDAYRLK